MNYERRKPVPGPMPLQDEGAERAVIGICLVQPEVFWDLQGRIATKHFTVPRLARIWDAMQSLAAAGKPVTREMIPLAIRGDDKADLGLPAFMATLLADVPSPSFAQEFADSLEHLAGRRALLEELDLIRSQVMAADVGTSIDEISEAAIGRIVSAGAAAFDRHMRSLGDWAEDVFKASQAALDQGEDGAVGLSFGLRGVDEVFGRAMPERLYILAGISSAGKSALARQIAEAMAGQCRERNLGWGYIASLEMSGRENATRSLAEQLEISTTAIEEGSLGVSDVERMWAAKEALRGLPLMIDTKPRMRMSDLRSRMIRLKNQKRLAFAMIDHLLLVKPEGRSDSIMERVSDATIEAKLLSRELEIPIILLAQLNEKSVIDRPSGRPNKTDLFGGQTINQNADAIGFIHRPETILAKKEPPSSHVEKHAEWSLEMARVRGTAEFFSDKRRGGVSGERRYLAFDGPTVTFRDV